jgi:hypothetical protein
VRFRSEAELYRDDVWHARTPKLGNGNQQSQNQTACEMMLSLFV